MIQRVGGTRSVASLVRGWVGVVLLAVVLSAYALSYPLNHDVGWYLYVAGALLEGEGLYRSLIEINPPLSSYLSVVPVLLASKIGHPVEIVTKLLVLMLVLLTTAWSTWLVAATNTSRWLSPLFAAAALLALLGAPGIDFGQREHLMMAFVLPYVVVTWRRLTGNAVGRSAAILAGALGGVGIALKPHFVVIWLALEAWHVMRGRSGLRAALRLESLAVVGVGALYLLFVINVHREYFGLLWEARELYAQFNSQARGELALSAHLVPLLFGLFLLRRAEGARALLAQAFLVVAATGFAIMILQGKGWSYHLYPVLAGSIVLTMVLVDEIVRTTRWSLSSQALMRSVALCLLIVGLASVAGTALQQHTAERDRRLNELDARVPYFSELSTGSAVLFLTDRVEEGFPLVTRTRLEWGSAFSHLWWIKALYQDSSATAIRLHEPDEMPRLEQRYVDALIGRMRKTEPDYVLVDTTAKSFYGGNAFPYVEYLSRFPGFRDEWRRYERAGQLDGFAVWSRGVRGAGNPE
jgi:hypothetical protein